MYLTPRLKCIADKVKRGSYPADIGTDHAYIPIYLIQNGICDRAVATDVRDGPLERAGVDIQNFKLWDKIKLRKGYGLAPVLGDDIDCAIMSGMGGYLICDILSSEKSKAEKIDYFIIQPMQFPERVREFLYNNGYHIYEEELVREDNKIYQVMCAEHGEETVDDSIHFEIGKRLIEYKDPLLPVFISSKMSETEKIIKNIESNGSMKSVQKLQEYRDKLAKYKEIYKCL